MENGRPGDAADSSGTGQQRDGLWVETHDNPTIVTDNPGLTVDTSDYQSHAADTQNNLPADTLDNPTHIVNGFVSDNEDQV